MSECNAVNRKDGRYSIPRKAHRWEPSDESEQMSGFIDKEGCTNCLHFQRDTLETLSVCLPVYGPGVAQEFSRKLWNLLKLEVIYYYIMF